VPVAEDNVFPAISNRNDNGTTRKVKIAGNSSELRGARI